LILLQVFLVLNKLVGIEFNVDNKISTFFFVVGGLYSQGMYLEFDVFFGVII
jgi:hypothetical protein